MHKNIEELENEAEEQIKRFEGMMYSKSGKIDKIRNIFKISNIYKILRITGWLLVAATLLTVFSGFLLTKPPLIPLVGYAIMYNVHTYTALYAFIPLFYLHTLTGILILISRYSSLNKKYLKIAIGSVWTSIFVIFMLLYVVQNPVQGITPKIANVSAITNMVPKEVNINALASDNTAAAAGPRMIASVRNILNPSEIRKHNSATNCWLIINDKVYDVTSYLKFHPGGPETITPYCGQDATAAFAGQPHSPNAETLLSSFYIGDLESTATSIIPAASPSSTSMPSTTQYATSTTTNTTQPTPTKSITSTSASSTTTTTTSATTTTISGFTLAEIGTHNSSSSCWLIISNKVYDVTSYLPYHPAGPSAILPYCGKDATTVFAAIGHSQNAQNLLASFYIRDVGSTTITSTTSTTTTRTTTTTVPSTTTTSATSTTNPISTTQPATTTTTPTTTTITTTTTLPITTTTQPTTTTTTTAPTTTSTMTTTTTTSTTSTAPATTTSTTTTLTSTTTSSSTTTIQPNTTTISTTTTKPEDD